MNKLFNLVNLNSWQLDLFKDRSIYSWLDLV